MVAADPAAEEGVLLAEVYPFEVFLPASSRTPT
jgi:hypothetical protein